MSGVKKSPTYTAPNRKLALEATVFGVLARRGPLLAHEIRREVQQFHPWATGVEIASARDRMIHAKRIVEVARSGCATFAYGVPAHAPHAAPPPAAPRDLAHALPA